MLISATVSAIEQYADQAYRLALNPAASCYPFYGDGIKTKSDFLCAAKRAVTEENAEVLLFCAEGTVEGWISYFWIPEEHYLQLDGFSIARGTAQALAELINMLAARFFGYKAYFGFPGDHHEAIRFLAEHGFQCVEQSWNHSFFFDGYTPKECSSCVEKISRRNFDRFRAIYHADPETYWNADRIFAAIENWMVFVYNRADRPIAAVFLTGNNGYFEIYGTEFSGEAFQEAVFRELLAASLNACKAMAAKYLTYFCKEREKHVLSEFGFRCIGEYVLYVKTFAAEEQSR